MVSDTFGVKTPPFETTSLRRQLTAFFDTLVRDPGTGAMVKLGNYQWGAYAFFDYDGEPIYVGQTKESLRTRIRRHLTNQRTDAVAMNVLDPFEVHTVKVWPLPQFEGLSKTPNREAFASASEHLDGLERQIYDLALASSRFGAVLNEKDPPAGTVVVEVPPSHEQCIVAPEVYALRKHPDIRIARRALVISRLAQVIEERKVNLGLRRVLVTQAVRLSWLTEQRLMGITEGS